MCRQVELLEGAVISDETIDSVALDAFAVHPVHVPPQNC